MCEQLDDSCTHEDPDHSCPRFAGRVHVFIHTTVTFHTPSDPSNDDGMQQEIICAAPSWLKGMPRYDCILINSDNKLIGMCGMEVAQAICFFSFLYLGVTYPCTLVHWFGCISEEPDDDTGMWMVAPDLDCTGEKPVLMVIHIDCIFCAAHLIPIFRDLFVPDKVTLDTSLDYFKGFYVNQFVDHHAFNIAS